MKSHYSHVVCRHLNFIFEFLVMCLPSKSRVLRLAHRTVSNIQTLVYVNLLNVADCEENEACSIPVFDNWIRGN